MTPTTSTQPAPQALTRDNALDRIDGAFAVVISGATVRRHLFFGLPAAERAMQRAAARGHDAQLLLVRLSVVEEEVIRDA